MKQTILSYGGGTQTAAIIGLIAQGRLAKPDRIVMADTDREFIRTWEYTNTYIVPLLKDLGLELEIASHKLAKVDLYAKNGDMLMPAYDARSGSRLRTFCSSEWKKAVVRRYLRATGTQECIMWFGMSIDELGRLKDSDVQWIKNYYPLCFDVKMTRAECISFVERFGLPTPPKSRCWCCPHQGDSEWLEVQQYPDEWNKAVALDEQIYTSHNMRLHKSGKPLATIQLKSQQVKEYPLLDACEGEYCWIN